MFLDQIINQKIENIQSDFWFDIFRIISWLGKWQIALAIFVIFSAYLIYKRHIKWFLVLFLSSAFSVLLTALIKILILRPRPINDLLIQNDFSFPSGHATIATGFFFFLFYYFYKKYRDPLMKKLIVVVAIFLAILIGFSRIYLGVHYLSDVMAGYMIGLLGFFLGRTLIKS